ncbi:hypothetical protein L7F22_064247 [Adiantum nelumboides]|nr:hypothetical protein [Adiantum nelumboides]
MGEKRPFKKQGFSEVAATCGASISSAPSDEETELVRYLQQHTHIPLLLLSPTLADIASSHQTTAALALRSLGYALHHEDIVAAFTDECALAVLNTLLKVITTTDQKGLCRLGVWCLGVQEFGVWLLETQSHLIAKAITHAIDNPMGSKAVTYEALQAVVKMVTKAPKMRLEASIWAPPIYRKLLSVDKRERDMAEQCLKDIESSLLPPILSLSKEVAMDISQTLLCTMEKMVRSRALVVPTIRAWSWLIRLLGSKAAGENRVLVNQMLKVAEVTFTSNDSQVQTASLVAWEALIDVLINDNTDIEKQIDTVSPSTRRTHKPSASPSVKRLKLLMTPLLTIMSGANPQSIRLACWCTWTYLAHKLDFEINSSSVQAVVVTPMFEAVFKAGPERGCSGVWDLCLNALEAWITSKIPEKLDSRSTWAFSLDIEGGVSSPKTPSQIKSIDNEFKALSIRWASWSVESLELILLLIKALWICGLKDLKQSSDNLSLNGAIRLLFLTVRGIDSEGKGVVRPPAENVASVHAVIRLVDNLSVDFELLTEVEEPISTLWPAIDVLLEFGHLVLSSSFYKLPFWPSGSHNKNDTFNFHASPLNTRTLTDAVSISENLVTPIAYIIGMWVQVGCSVFCNNKEEEKVLQKLEKLVYCTKTGLGIMSNLQGVGIILNRLLPQNLKMKNKQLAGGVETEVGENSTGLPLSNKDFYFLQVWKIFAGELASYIENSNDVPAVEIDIEDSGYQVVHTFLLLPVQLCFNVINTTTVSENVSQGHSSHRHVKCLKHLQHPNELEFVAVAWARLYDCCSRVSSLKSSQPNRFGSAYCQKVSRYLEIQECSRDQGGIDKFDLCENALLLDMLGFVIKHVLRQIDISSLAMLAINRKKRLGSFIGGSYHSKGLLGNDVEDISNVRDSLCLASRLLDLTWSRLTTGKTCWLGISLRVLSALAGFVTRLYRQQDCLMLLQDFSRPLAKWLSFSKSACPLSEALQQALQDLWEKLLTLLQKCQPPLCYDSNLLALQSTLLVPSFQHSNTSISNSTLSFWESTYGCKASCLKYPPCLAAVLQNLREKVTITLPGWKNMALKDPAEIATAQPTGDRKHLCLLQDETRVNKRSKQANMDSRSEVEGMYPSSKLRSSNVYRNAKGKSIEKPLDALLDKIKRPSCVSPAFPVSAGNSENPVCKGLDAPICTSSTVSNDLCNEEACGLKGVECDNQNSEIKQKDKGVTHEASQAMHHNKEPSIKPLEVMDQPCDGALNKTGENPSLPLPKALASDYATSLQMVECENMPASECDLGGPARRKKLRFLDDEDIVYATIPLTQKKAGPLTDHQKEVRLAQTGTPGSGCTSHGAGIRTYTNVDFSQSQIVFDSEDPEDICLETPVQAVDDETFKGLDCSLITARGESKHRSMSMIPTNGILEEDKLLKLPDEQVVEHQSMHRGNLQSKEEQLQPRSSLGGSDTVNYSKVFRSGRKLMECLHAAISKDECKEFENAVHVATNFCKDQLASAAVTTSKSQVVEDGKTLSSISNPRLVASQENLNEKFSSTLHDKHQGSVMYREKDGMPDAKCIAELQYVPSPDPLGTKENCEQGEQSTPNMHMTNFNQVGGKNLSLCGSRASSLRNCLEQEALDEQTQLVTQPCNTQLLPDSGDTQLLPDSGDTQLLLDSDDEGFRLAPANGAIFSLLKAANFSGQWNDMDLQSLECAQRLVDSIQRQVDGRKMRLLARNPPIKMDCIKGYRNGLQPDQSSQEKVKGKFPETFEEALQIARVKDRKLEYQAHTSRVEHPQGPTMADERLPPAPTTTPEDLHLELLQRVTNQLDNLSINMVQGVRQQQPQPNNERMPNGPRRQPQRRDYFCYNCGEEGHGMYFCPHPRNFNAQAGRGRQQVTPPRARPPPQIQPQILQNPQMVAQPQVLQRSVSPQPVAEIPPLPNNNGERAVNVISIEGKGKAKMIEPCVMPIKKARMSKEANLRRDTMETKDEAGTSRKEKKRKKSETSRRRIGIKDFPLGAATEAYDLLEDLYKAGYLWQYLYQVTAIGNLPPLRPLAITLAGEPEDTEGDIGAGKRLLEGPVDLPGPKRPKLIINRLVPPVTDLVPLTKPISVDILDSLVHSPRFNITDFQPEDVETTRLMIKRDKLQQLQKDSVKGKFVMDNQINPTMTYTAPTSKFILDNEIV